VKTKTSKEKKVEKAKGSAVNQSAGKDKKDNKTAQSKEKKDEKRKSASKPKGKK
jgi:hypothetical protein